MLNSIDKLQFGILSPDVITQYSVVEVTKSDTFENNVPVVGGLFDRRMGTLNKEECLTCHQTDLKCPGHFGHIILAKPIYNVEFVDIIKKILNCVCFRCSKLIINKDKLIAKNINKIRKDGRLKKIIQIIGSAKKKICSSNNGCGSAQPTITKTGYTLYYEFREEGNKEKKKIITAEYCYNILKRISNEDCKIMGLDPLYSRPEWMIYTVLPVSPPQVRPPAKVDGSNRCEDDLTFYLDQIIKWNKYVESKEDIDAKGLRDRMTNILTYYVNVMINNNLPNISHTTAHRSGRTLKSIKTRLKGKTGRIRGYLLGKRVDFSGRSVITADPNIDLDEFGLPKKVAMNLTFPEIVTKENINEMYRLIHNGPNKYPGAKNVIKMYDSRNSLYSNKKHDKVRYDLRWTNIKNINLEIGDIIERHLKDGDIILVNRQPTLHKPSMMGHRIRVMNKGLTFRLNISATTPYNADFDGDEMNIFVPQSVQTSIELEQLAAVPHQIILPKDNKPIIGIIQDTLLGISKFTKDSVRLPKNMVMDLLTHYDKFDGNLPEPLYNEDGVDYWNGRQIISLLLPEINLFKFSNVYEKKGYEEIDTHVKIIKGEILSGILDKNTVGKSAGSIIHIINNEYGSNKTKEFIWKTMQIIDNYLIYHGFSTGFADLVPDPKIIDKIKDIINTKEQKVVELLKKVENRTYIPSFSSNPTFYFTSSAIAQEVENTIEESVELEMMSIVTSARDEAMSLMISNVSSDNYLMGMVNSGSKGKNLNIAQIMACLGQQEFEQKRIPKNYGKRSLPHYHKFDDSPESRGFVKNSYYHGLNPVEFYFHHLTGREGLMDTAVKTSESGYIARKLIKAMEDIVVSYDNTVRNATGHIIQFLYGEDNITYGKLEKQKYESMFLNNEELKKKYLFNETEFEKFLHKKVIKKIKKIKNYNKILEKEYNTIYNDRETLRYNIFTRSYNNDINNSPINIRRLIINAKSIYNLEKKKKSSLNPIYVIKKIDELCEEIPKLYLNSNIKEIPDNYISATLLLRILIRSSLASKRIITEYYFNKDALEYVIENIKINLVSVLVDPGEAVGVITGESISEPTTQMSLEGKERIKILKLEKNSARLKFYSGRIGSFCDKIIKKNPKHTLSTGHKNSVETSLQHLNYDYYIIGVGKDEKTSWNKISHISRHPANGKMIKVTTKSGRIVNTTMSHSHLIRKNQTVMPIKGNDLKKGMRIPVAKYIPNTFVMDKIKIGDYEYILDKDFGWFIGAYLAEGSISKNCYRITITNISEHFIEMTTKIAKRFNRNIGIREKQGEYGKSVDSYFNHKDLAIFLKSKCKTGSYVKRIPGFVFSAPNEFKAGLIQGYFDGDGNIMCDKRHHYIRVCSRSKQLAKDIALLLSYFGIFSTINKNIVFEKPMYRLSFSNKYAPIYKKEIGSILHADKLNNLVAYAERSSAKNLSDEIDKINGLGDIIAQCGKTLNLKNHSAFYGRWKRKEAIGRRTLQKYINVFECHENSNKIKDELIILKQAANSTVIWDEIVDIHIYDLDEYVYDFTVPGNQTFMTDYGVIVHNTLNSVEWNTEILIRKNGYLERVTIGKYIDDYVKNSKIDNIENHPNNTTLAYIKNDNIEIMSVDEDGNMGWKKVEAVTKHPPINKDGSNTLVKIRTRHGREVIATKAKSFLTLKDNKIVPIKGEDITTDIYLPINIHKYDVKIVKYIHVDKYLPKTQYIYGSEIIKALSVSNESFWWKKYNNTLFTTPYKRSDTLLYANNGKLRKGCKTKQEYKEGFVYPKKCIKVKAKIPDKIELTYNFGYLLGAYIAEGCITNTQISISNNELDYFKPIIELCNELNITYKIYTHCDKSKIGWTSRDIRLYSSVLTQLLNKMCGKLSHNKRIPIEILSAPLDCLQGMLSAYISGDGTISIHKDKAVYITSVSKGLLEDIQQVLIQLDNIYSSLHIPTKITKNNRDSKNIKQHYIVRIANKNVIKLYNNITLLKDKQIRLKQCSTHHYKYNIGRYDIIPEITIDNITYTNIHREKLSKQYQNIPFDNIYFDKVISVDEVESKYNYVYDLTVADTKNFNIYNGLCMRDTFHFAGVGSKSNLTRGVPRVKELLSVMNVKLPTVIIELNEEDKYDKVKCKNILSQIEYVSLIQLVEAYEIFYDTDPLYNSIIKSDRKMIDDFFKNSIDEDKDTLGDLSNWLIRIKLRKDIMISKQIRIIDIRKAIKNSNALKSADDKIKNNLYSIFTDDNSEELIFRIQIKNNIFTDKKEPYQLVKDITEKIFSSKFVIKGIKDITLVELRERNNRKYDPDTGDVLHKKEYYLDTDGTNLQELLLFENINASKTYSNDIEEVHKVLGIEAVRNLIINELRDVIEFGGDHVDYRHFSIVADTMTNKGVIMALDRHGIRTKSDNPPLAKASFEQTPDRIKESAIYGEVDNFNGVSANQIFGQFVPIGTNSFDVLFDEQMYMESFVDVDDIVDDLDDLL